jgi:hypothetical protein
VRPAALLLLFSAFTCGQAEETETPAVEADYGERFVLALGDHSDVGGRFRVTFARVSEDSRCPEGVECVQAGNAAATFAVESEEGSASLTLNTGREPRRAAAMGHVLGLIDLRPRPSTGAPVDSAAYEATLMVEPVP